MQNSSSDQRQPQATVHQAPVRRVTRVERTENQYVYDIGMADTERPWYFGNNILIHNSSIFSAWPIIQGQSDIEWNREVCVQLYDQIGQAVNDSFPDFMARACNCPREYGEIIRAGREIVGSKGLFIKKKRYAVLVYDHEGRRMDVDGQPGKLKAMGLDLKRADTPKVVQDFLIEVLLEVLQGTQRPEIAAKTREFKVKFAALPPWEKGTPKRVNNLTAYHEKIKQRGIVTVPGHVRAAINWNGLRDMYSDRYSMQIADGMKVIVCKLKDNPMGYTSVAYPIDQTHIPDWFKQLPFDDDLMEATVVDKKVENLLGVLKWNISDHTNTKTQLADFFQWD
jgi:hypothetical protein